VKLKTARKGSRKSSSKESASSPESIHGLASKLESLSIQDLVGVFFDEERRVEKALRSQSASIARGVKIVHRALESGGRLIYVGAGTSGRLGVLDASEIPPTFGYPPDRVIGLIAGGPEAVFRSQEGAEDSLQKGESDLKKLRIGPRDVVCGIAASGRTPYVLGALGFARAQKAKTIFLTCNPLRKRTVRVDLSIDLPTGPEIIAGSTRLKGGTATKLVLNMLTSIAMIQLGRVKGGRMTHLQASNAKLRDRAIRNVVDLGGVSRLVGEEALVQSGWNVAQALELIQRGGGQKS
jgi:N-acetylmuramic acid 6-phosphate etherase